MNKPAMIKAMKASIFEVLERMFFLTIDMVEAEQENTTTGLSDRQSITVSVGFDGPLSGNFLLTIPADLAESVTADFLGTVPENLSKEQITGTIKEMTNILAGNSLSAYNPESPINLQIPELIAAPKDDGTAREGKGTIDMGIETLNGRMTFHLATQQP